MKQKLKAVRFRTMIKVGKGLQRDVLDVEADKRWLTSLTYDDANGRIEAVTDTLGLHEIVLIPPDNVTVMYPMLEAAPVAKAAPVK